MKIMKGLHNFRTKYCIVIVTPNNSYRNTYFNDPLNQNKFSEITEPFDTSQPFHVNLYYPTGGLKSSFYMNRKGEINGPYSELFEDGYNKLVTEYSNGVINGNYATFYEGTIQIHEKSQYANGKYNGKFVLYYPNSRIKVEATFKDDVPLGAFTVRYDNENNSLMIQCSFTPHGTIEGEFNVYADTGEKSITMNFDTKGDFIGRIEHNVNFVMSKVCQESYSHIITLNTTNKKLLKTDVDDFDNKWNKLVSKEDENYQYGWHLTETQGWQQGWHQGRANQEKVATSNLGYQGGWSNQEWYKNYTANKDKEYEQQLAKAIEESQLQTDNLSIANASFRSMIDAHRDEQNVIHTALSEKNSLLYLQEMCTPWLTIENEMKA